MKRGAAVILAALIGMALVHSNSRGAGALNELGPFDFAEIRGIRVHYHLSAAAAAGDPTIVLVPGYGASMQTWYDIYPALRARLPVLRLDLRGFGFTDKPDDDRYSFDEQAEIVSELITKLGLRRVVLVGHSYGGGVAYLSYLKLRDRPAAAAVEGLVLIDSAAYRQRVPFFVKISRYRVTRWFSETFTTPEWRIAFLLRWIFIDDSRVDPARVQRHAFFLRQPHASRGLARTARHAVPANADDLSALLGTVRIPTLVLWGARDPAIPVKFAHRLGRDIPGAVVHVIPNAGHTPQEEAPERLLPLLLPFLERVAAASAAAPLPTPADS